MNQRRNSKKKLQKQKIKIKKYYRKAKKNTKQETRHKQEPEKQTQLKTVKYLKISTLITARWLLEKQRINKHNPDY